MNIPVSDGKNFVSLSIKYAQNIGKNNNERNEEKRKN
jgi:hypothetical protein